MTVRNYKSFPLIKWQEQQQNNLLQADTTKEAWKIKPKNL